MKVAIVGLGLIGGSLALACREHDLATVAGHDPDPAVRAAAAARGACHSVHETLAGALDGADSVFLAAPVGALAQLAEQVLEIVGPECVVSDVGSTKRALCEQISDPRFIGGHPLAGAETAGIEHARADLFEGAAWYLTPRTETTGVLYERLYRMLAALGARPAALDAAEHDRMMAAVSHVPHVVANVMVGQVAGALAGEGDTPLAAIGPSLRDATRVAGSNSSIWGDIYVANAAAIVAGLERLEAALADARALIAGGEREAIVDWNDAARRRRDELLDTAIGVGLTQELRVSVPNRPGVVAEIALALGSAGVNIVDLVLSPSLDGSQGTVALWVVGDDAARRAEELIAGLELPVARP
jgi:prephenate dehydrogenase